MTDLDPYDRKILSALTENARLSMVDLAARVGLSKTPVAARVRALEEKGVIQGYRAILSPEKLGLAHVAYVEVRLLDTRQAALQEFNEAARRVPDNPPEASRRASRRLEATPSRRSVLRSAPRRS